jgi:hypothetical protein
MKPAASLRGALRRFQGGTAAVELALILSATIVMVPAVALFAKVFFQYSVIKSATQDVAAYLASLPPAMIKDPVERGRAFDVAQQMVDQASLAAGLTGSSSVAAPVLLCDNHSCNNLVPEVFVVTVSLTIDDMLFNALTGAWTDHTTKVWEVTATSTVPFSK